MARNQKKDTARDPAQPVRQSARLKRSLPPDTEAQEPTQNHDTAGKGSNSEGKVKSKPRSGKRRKMEEYRSANDENEAVKISNAESHEPTPHAALDTARSGHSYWLMKAEPESRIEKGVDVKFSIHDLQACTEPEPWEGVRNHVAKNNMIAMKKGDLAFFYHSNCKVPGIAGVMEVVQESSVDKSALDEKHPYYDAKSDASKPRWFCVNVGFQRKFPRYIPLKELQSYKGPGQPLEHMQLHKQSRLSVSKVSDSEWKFILELAEREPEESEKAKV